MSEAIRAQLERIVASAGFVSAGRLAPFLSFVVERTLAGEPVKEALIGVHVFGRPADYDPRLDPIVRVEARRLRARLASYYGDRGALDPIVIELPKGGYVPLFRSRDAGSSGAAQPGAVPTDDGEQPATGGAEATVAGRFRWVSAVVLVLAAAAVAMVWWWPRHTPSPPPSVAVLPFLNLDGSDQDDSFSDGLTEEILDRLARLEGLRVVARGSSFQFKGQHRDLREVARALHATAVVEGSVRRAGDTLRITAHLVDAEHGFHLWSQTYERGLVDVFAIQDEIALAIAQALRVELRVGPTGRAQRPTDNLIAYDLYLKGRHHLNRDALAGLELATDSFERAIETDREYAVAHAALARAYALLGYYQLRPASEAWPLAQAAADRALTLDPSLAEAWAFLGFVAALHEWRWDEAERYFRHAIELDPSSSDVRVAYATGVLLPHGRMKELLRELDQAVALDPGSFLAHQARSFALLAAGEVDRAVASYRRTVELGPSHADAQWDLGMALAYAGDRKTAMRQFRLGGNIREGGRWSPEATEYALFGETAKARESIARWGDPDAPRALFAAYAHALLGDADEAAAWLQRAYQERDPQVVWIKVDPRLAKVRQDPRIQALIREIGL